VKIGENPAALSSTALMSFLNGVYGRNWPDVVRGMFGEEPHIIPADPLFEASRQALEIESLKLRPEESQGLAALLSYIRYLASQLSI